MKLTGNILTKFLLEHSEFTWVWFQWLSVTLAGFLLSLLVIEVGEKPDLGFLEGAIGGTLIGLAQSFILGQNFAQVWRWVAVSLVSWAFMADSGLGAIGWMAPRTDLLGVRLLFGAIWGALGGLWLGMGQWLVLRKQVSDSWHWIVAQAISWSVALSVGWAVGGALRWGSRLFLGEVVGLWVTWTIVGAMTGVALIVLLRRQVYKLSRI